MFQLLIVSFFFNFKGIPPDNQRMIMQGKVLKDENTLAEYSTSKIDGYTFFMLV